MFVYDFMWVIENNQIWVFVGLLKPVYHDTGDDCISQHFKKNEKKGKKKEGRNKEGQKTKNPCKWYINMLGRFWDNAVLPVQLSKRGREILRVIGLRALFYFLKL